MNFKLSPLLTVTLPDTETNEWRCRKFQQDGAPVIIIFVDPSHEALYMGEDLVLRYMTNAKEVTHA